MIEKFEYISLEQLRDFDEHFRISWGRDIDALAQSVRKVGVLQPLWVVQADDTLKIVDGFRRVEAALATGVGQIPVLFLDFGLEEKEVYLLALENFLSKEQPNPVEVAVALEKLARWYDREELIEKFLPKLGVHQTALMLRRYRAVLDMPERVKEGLADGRIFPVCAQYLERMAPEDRQTAGQFLLQLRPSKSAQKEMLEYLNDLSMREGVSVEELLDVEEVKKIFSRKPANLPQQREAFRAWLKAQRFPVLHRAKSSYEEAVKKIRPGSRIRIDAPPYFEGRDYGIRFSFRDFREFEEAVEKLEDMKNRKEDVEQLWK
jgi:ParB-like chromosome segregation protein Spo0J